MGKVRYKNNGDEEEVQKGTELKDVTKDAGWPIAYGCEDGMCGTCVIKVNEGEKNLGEKNENETQTLSIMGLEEGGYRLACQCQIEEEGDVEIESL